MYKETRHYGWEPGEQQKQNLTLKTSDNAKIKQVYLLDGKNERE